MSNWIFFAWKIKTVETNETIKNYFFEVFEYDNELDGFVLKLETASHFWFLALKKLEPILAFEKGTELQLP